MPKNKKRRTKEAEKDPFAPAADGLTEGVLDRFHRIQQRYLRDMIRELEIERLGIAKRNRDLGDQRKQLTSEIRALRERFKAKCERELEAVRTGAAPVVVPMNSSSCAPMPPAAAEAVEPAAAAALASSSSSTTVLKAADGMDGLVGRATGTSARRKRRAAAVAGDSLPGQLTPAVMQSASSSSSSSSSTDTTTTAQPVFATARPLADDVGQVLSRG